MSVSAAHKVSRPLQSAEQLSPVSELTLTLIVSTAQEVISVSEVDSYIDSL